MRLQIGSQASDRLRRREQAGRAVERGDAARPGIARGVADAGPAARQRGGEGAQQRPVVIEAVGVAGEQFDPPARRRGSIAPRQRRRQHLLPVQRDPLRLDQRQRIFAVHPEGQRQPAPFGARQTPARIGARLRQALAQQHPQPLRVARHRIDRRRGIGAAQLSRQRLDRRRSLRPVFGGAHREAAASAARARVSVASSSDGVR